MMIRNLTRRGFLQVTLLALAGYCRGRSVIGDDKTEPKKTSKTRTLKLPQGVTAKVPKTWKTIQEAEIPDGKVVAFELPYAKADDTPHSANGALVVRKLPEGVAVGAFADTLLVRKKDEPGFVVVNREKDGEEWLTVLWIAAQDDGTKYPALHRFGVHKGVGVEFLVNFPLLKEGDPVWIKESIQQFNDACDSLSIAETGSHLLECALENGVLMVRKRPAKDEKSS